MFRAAFVDPDTCSLNSNHHVVSVFPRFCEGEMDGKHRTERRFHIRFSSSSRPRLVAPPIDQTSLTPSTPPAAYPTNRPAALHLAVLPPATSSCFLLMTQLPSVPTFNYQHPTSTDHRTAMHRQQNPPNVPIIELGELVGLERVISWGRSDCRNTVPSQLY